MYDITFMGTISTSCTSNHPKLFEEMYGYILSTVALNLPHIFIKSFVVSTTITTDREDWDYIDQLPDAIEAEGGGANQMCHIANAATTRITAMASYATIPTPPLPVALRYCSRYVLGLNFFSKYRLKTI
jgi:hypothetical protein